MPRNKIDYDTILACKSGESEAFSRVLMHYDHLINKVSSKTIIDEFGVKKIVVDQEMKEHIQQALMLQNLSKLYRISTIPSIDLKNL